MSSGRVLGSQDDRGLRTTREPATAGMSWGPASPPMASISVDSVNIKIAAALPIDEDAYLPPEPTPPTPLNRVCLLTICRTNSATRNLTFRA